MNFENDGEQCIRNISTRKQKRRKKKSVATNKDYEQESSDEEWEWSHKKKVQNTNIEREFDADETGWMLTNPLKGATKERKVVKFIADGA